MALRTPQGRIASVVFTWRAAVASTQLPAPSKLVAFALSLYMSERGDSAYPSNATLSADTSLSERAVRTHLAELVEHGWLERDPEPVRGRGNTVNYRAVIPAGGADFGKPAPHDRKTGTSRQENRHLTTGKPAGEAPEVDRKKPIDSDRDSDTLTAAPQLMVVEDPFDLFWKAYPHHNRGKAEARRAWGRALHRAPPDTVIAGARRLAADPNLPEPRFIPRAATWLNQDRWEDGPLPARGVTPARHNPMEHREAGARRVNG